MLRFLLVILLSPLMANAKLADIDNAQTKTTLYNFNVSIDEKGRTVETIEEEYEILKESSSNLAANYTLYYDGDSQKVTILDAKSFFLGKEYKVDVANIEDKPLASSHEGFDQTKQILIAFTNTEIGAKIYLKYKIETLKVPFEGFYGERFGFGNYELINHAEININSKIPLHIEVNDPNHSLKITKNQNDNFHKLNVKLIKPVYVEAVNEPNGSNINKKYQTYFTLSSLNKWDDLGPKFSSGFAKIYQQSLPPLFEEIRIEAAKENKEIDQLNTVVSSIQNKIRYMGDWKTIEGGFKPRDLAIIAESRIGDCKDYASTLVSILTKLGYKAQIVIVNRGTNNYSIGKLPINEFNHAMTKVTTRDGKIYWIDPTNIQTMIDGIFPDIEGKKVLVLDNKNPTLEQIPYIDINHSKINVRREVNILSENNIFENGTILAQNELALPLIGAGLSSSEEVIKDSLLNYMSDAILEEKNEKKIIFPDLKSRLVRDLKIDYSYTLDNQIVKTNLGQAIALKSSPSVESFTKINKEYISDAYIGEAGTYTYETIYKNLKIDNAQNLNFEINSPWLYARRKCTYANNKLIVDDNFIVYKSFINNEDLTSIEFQNFKKKLEQNIKSVSIVLNK